MTSSSDNPNLNIVLALKGPYTPPHGLAIHLGLEQISTDPLSPRTPVYGSGIRSGFRAARSCDRQKQAVWQRRPVVERGVTNTMKKAQPVQAGEKRCFSTGIEPLLKSGSRTLWHKARAQDRQGRSWWRYPAPRDRSGQSSFAAAHGHDRISPARWIVPTQHHDIDWHGAWDQLALRDMSVDMVWRNSISPRDLLHRNYWGNGLYRRICFRAYEPPPGLAIHLNLHKPIEDVGDKDHIDFFLDSMTYDLRCHQREPGGWRDPNIRGGLPDPYPITPKLAVYIIMNSASLMRVSDNAEIPCFSMRVQADIDSWCWSFSATIPATSLELVMPGTEPVEVEATINGHSWRIWIESWSENKAFGQTSYSIKGRSPSAMLAAPYAPIKTGFNSSDSTAQQLALEQLLNTDWSLDWNTVDWLVGAEALNYSNATPLKVIQQIVEASGSRIQTHRTEPTLITLPRLHSLPWDWPGATPDREISDYVMRQLSREFLPGVSYNAVFVSGETQGVLTKVVRTQTAGDELAPMVTDALITATEVARERGKMIIGRTGNWNKERLELPLGAPDNGDIPGLLEIGKLVSVEETSLSYGKEEDKIWRGQVAGVEVSAAWQRGAGLKVSQSVEVERYRGD